MSTIKPDPAYILKGSICPECKKPTTKNELIHRRCIPQIMSNWNDGEARCTTQDCNNPIQACENWRGNLFVSAHCPDHANEMVPKLVALIGEKTRDIRSLQYNVDGQQIIINKQQRIINKQQKIIDEQQNKIDYLGQQRKATHQRASIAEQQLELRNRLDSQNAWGTTCVLHPPNITILKRTNYQQIHESDKSHESHASHESQKPGDLLLRRLGIEALLNM